MSMQRTTRVVQKYVQRTAPDWGRWVADPRSRHGRRIRLRRLLNALWVGALTASRTLREVEALTERMGDRVPDSTMHDLLVKLPAVSFRRMLVRQVKQAWRSKKMQPLGRWSMVVVDGKSVWFGAHQANEHCARVEQGGELRFHMKVLRAMSVSGAAKLHIGQMPVRPGKNEMSTFPEFFAQLIEDYGDTEMMQVVSLDAGYASEATARLVDEAGRGYIIGLKENQPELYREAKRVLGRRKDPDAETPWERCKGGRMRRKLFRTREMADYHGWTHLREVWRVRQEFQKDGRTTVEERYFLTNLPPGATPEEEPLHMVRAHWSIENHGNWVMDVLWQEDHRPWASAALEVVSLLRLLAYNAVTLLRTRVFRSAWNRARSWRNVLDLIGDALRQIGARYLTGPHGRPEGVAAFG